MFSHTTIEERVSVMINKKIIDEALEFYDIDNKYKIECYETL